MIGYIKGTVLELNTGYCLVLTNSGVGYEISIPSNLSGLAQGDHIELFVKTISKDTGVELYGFPTKEEKLTFEVLLEITKLGPKIAINIVSSFSFRKLEEIVIKEDWRLLTSVSGVGPKLAKRIVWELKEKLPSLLIESSKGRSNNSIYKDALSGLKNLGYKDSEIRPVLDRIAKEHDDISEEYLIKKALMLLSKGHSYEKR